VDRIRGRDAIAAIVVTTLIMIVVVLVKPRPFDHLAFPWYVPMGTGLALLMGWGSSLVGGAGSAGSAGS
jgi:hypothetical protein